MDSQYFQQDVNDILRALYTEMIGMRRELRNLQSGTSNQNFTSVAGLSDIHNDLVSTNTKLDSLISTLSTLTTLLTSISTYASYMNNMNVVKDDRGQYVQVVRDFETSQLLEKLINKIDALIDKE